MLGRGGVLRVAAKVRGREEVLVGRVTGSEGSFEAAGYWVELRDEANGAASWLCRLATECCIVAKVSFISLSSEARVVDLGIGVGGGAGVGGRRCDLCLLSPLKSLWKTEARASFLTGYSCSNSSADFKILTMLASMQLRAIKADFGRLVGLGGWGGVPTCVHLEFVDDILVLSDFFCLLS